MLAAEVVISGWYVFQQLKGDEGQERTRKKSSYQACHFLHTNTFHTQQTLRRKCVDLVMSCGGADLKYFLETAGWTAMCTSHVTVLDLVEVQGPWVKESLLWYLQEASCYSISWQKRAQILQLWKNCWYCFTVRKENEL